jgi:hypothetical protein
VASAYTIKLILQLQEREKKGIKKKNVQISDNAFLETYKRANFMKYNSRKVSATMQPTDMLMQVSVYCQ